MMFPFRFGIRFLTAGLFLAGIAAGVPVPTFASAYACPFLDEPHEAWREWDIGFVSRGRSGKDREKTSVVETRLRGMLVYWENDGGGDLEVQADVDVRTLSGGVADPSIYALTMARVILQWSQRFRGDFGARADFSPGYYSRLGKGGRDSWAAPFGVTVIRALDEHVAVQAGLSFYPGFFRSIDPRLGLRWRYDDSVWVDVAYPASQLRLRVSEGIYLQGGLQWQLWPEYGMGNDDKGRLRFKETRAWGGAEMRLHPDLALSASVGYAFERRIRFERDRAAGAALSDAVFFQLGFAWLY